MGDKQYYTVSQGAAVLGVSQPKFRAKMREHNIEPIPNEADNRSKLYPKDRIDDLAKRAIPITRPRHEQERAIDDDGAAAILQQLHA